MNFGKLNLTIFVTLSLLCHSAAFARDGGERIANRQISNVSDCISGTQGVVDIQNSHLTLTYQTQRLVLEVQDISGATTYGRALFVGNPIENVYGLVGEDKETLRFVSNGSKSAMQLCDEVRTKIITGFGVKQ